MDNKVKGKRANVIVAQADLCHALMGRLLYDISQDANKPSPLACSGMKNKTQKIADAIRLRRELNNLIALIREDDYHG